MAGARPRRAVLIDDVERNAATGRFLQAHPETAAAICISRVGEALVGCLVKPLDPGRRRSRAIGDGARA